MEAEKVNNPEPPKILEFSGRWEPYEETLFQIFKTDFIDRSLQFQGLPVKIKKHPVYKEKHFAFWHLISEGEREEERTPDFRRCERLSWVSWVIENCERTQDISCWENKRGSNRHVVIWYQKENYVVVLAKRKGYFLLKSSYLADKNRTRGFIEEHDAFKKKKL